MLISSILKSDWKNGANAHYIGRQGAGLIMITFLVLLSTLTTCFAQGQRAPDSTNTLELVTDRPDQTESTSVIPPAYLQLETGWTVTHDEGDALSIKTHELPGSLLRIGVVNRLELRIGWKGGIWETTRELGQKTKSSGHGDAEIGFKFYLREEEGWIPETALLTGVSLPVGQKALSSHRLDPAFRVLLSHHLSDRISLGYNLGASWESQLEQNGDRDTHSFFNYTVAMGIAITDRVGSFVELFGDIPLDAVGKPKNYFDGGFTYLVQKNLQLDFAAGLGLSADADDWFLGLGFSVRLPQ